jgi:hypothetical protein
MDNAGRNTPSSRRNAGAVLLLCVVATFGAGTASAASPPRFPSGAVWHQSIVSAPVHTNSTAMIDRLNALGGWGMAGGVNHRFHIDFSLHVRHLANGENPPRYPVVEHADFEDYYAPDCDPVGTLMPIPADAAIEGETDLTCPNESSDCHLIVVDGSTLYEAYSANFNGAQLDAYCLATWDLNVVYPPEGRGDHCTSADAAGFPIAPLLVNADEVNAAMSVADSDLGHAIRFILPNARMASDVSLGGVGGRLYVRPASHAGGPNGPVDSVPYGARMRLRGDFDMSGYNAAAQVVLRTMQRYGIVLADGGNIALTFESDRFTTTQWSTLGITPQIFWSGTAGNRTPVRVTDFAVIDTGARIGETFNCVRSPVVVGNTIFHNGFEGG